MFYTHIADVEQEVMNIAKWLACVYRNMDEFNTDDEIRNKLRSLPMVPLANDEFVSLSDKAIFFPLHAEERRKKMQDAKGIRILISLFFNSILKP